MTQDEFLENMIDSGNVIVEAKELRYLLQKFSSLKKEQKQLKEWLENEKMLKGIWKKNYYNLLEEKRVKINLKDKK